MIRFSIFLILISIGCTKISVDPNGNVEINSLVSNSETSGSVKSLEFYKENIKQKKHLSYKEARRILFGKIHLEGNGNSMRIKDIYCIKNFKNSDISTKFKLGRNKIPDHRILNAEHVWPKSRFFASSRRKRKKYKSYEFKIREADLHILYPSDSSVNSTRSSYKFGEVIDDMQSEKIGCSNAQIGKARLKGKVSRSLFFEPPQESKGNVARAMFYYSFRYNEPIEFYEEEFLKKWHELDPPDDIERRRNDLIEQAQGNRNPFIDHPELVKRISDF